MEGQKAKLQRWPPKELLGSCRQSHATTQAFVEMEIESFVYRSVPLQVFRLGDIVCLDYNNIIYHY